MVDQWLEDPQYRNWWIPLMTLAAELASRQGQPKREAEIWYDVIQTIDREKEEDPRSEEWMSWGLKRLRALIGQHRDLLTEQQVTEIQLRLARLAETSSQEAQSLYRKILSSWQWSDIEEEISTSRTAHPDAAALAWLDIAPTSGHEPLLKWMADQPDTWTRWPLKTIRALEGRLGTALDSSPQVLLAGAHHLMAQSGKEILAAEFLLRAWVAGAPLSSSQLTHLANFLRQLPPDWCRKQLESGTDASELLQEMKEIGCDPGQMTSWIPLLPPSTIRKLPDDLMVEMLEATTSRNASPPTILLETIAIRMNAGNQVLLNQTAPAVAKHPHLAARILQVVVDRDPLWPEMVQVLFPYLLQDPNPTTAADVLDRLTTHPGLLQGNDRLACCLDNWRALREEMDSWRHLKKPRIEGKVLVEIVNRWIKDKECSGQTPSVGHAGSDSGGGGKAFPIHLAHPSLPVIPDPMPGKSFCRGPDSSDRPPRSLRPGPKCSRVSSILESARPGTGGPV